MFEAPVPGQSLTSAPGKYPYERPPEISDPKQALEMHLAQLSKEGMAENIVNALELDIDIKTLTEGILRNAVSKGVHSIDISLAIAPVIHRFIKDTADQAGIDYEEGLEDKDAKAEKKKAVEKALAYKRAERYDPDAVEEAPMEEPMPEESKGILKRRTK